jgi:hypothetical protein
MEDMYVLRHVKTFKKAMESAMELFQQNDEYDDKFYRSSFTLAYNCKITGKTTTVELPICPEIWDLIENLIEKTPEALEDCFE